MNHKITAFCMTCNADFTASAPDDQRKRYLAAISNREIWMQTHRDTTDHTRFSVVDVDQGFRIVGRSSDDQMLLSDDPNYSTFRLGEHDG